MSDNSATMLEKPLEDKFKTADGRIDQDAIQAHLQRQQARAKELSLDEIREAITLTRILRRTNTTTGPAKRKGKAPTRVINPDDILDI